MGLFCAFADGDQKFYDFLHAVLTNVAMGAMPMMMPKPYVPPKHVPTPPKPVEGNEPVVIPPTTMPMMTQAIDPVFVVGAGVGLVIIFALVLRR